MSNNKPLPKRHQAFIDEYLKCFNATRAYLKVYPKSTYDAARANSSRLITQDNIKEQIAGRMDALHMSADEALKLLADQARGDICDVLNEFGGFDITTAKGGGKTKLIKRLRTTTTTINGKEEDKEIHTEEVELYDAQAALRDILKIHGKFIDRAKIEGPGENGEHVIRVTFKQDD